MPGPTKRKTGTSRKAEAKRPAVDDARARYVPGLLMSLKRLVETPGGFDYTPSDCRAWMKATGFRKTAVVALTPAESMVIGSK